MVDFQAEEAIVRLAFKRFLRGQSRHIIGKAKSETSSEADTITFCPIPKKSNRAVEDWKCGSRRDFLKNSKMTT